LVDIARTLGDVLGVVAVVIGGVLVASIVAATGAASGLAVVFGALAAVNPLVWVGAAIAGVALFHDELVDTTSAAIDLTAAMVGLGSGVEDATIAQTIWFRNAQRRNAELIEERRATQEVARFWGEYGFSVKAAAEATLRNLNPTLDRVRDINPAVSAATRALQAFTDVIGITERATTKTGDAFKQLVADIQALEHELDPAKRLLDEVTDRTRILDRAVTAKLITDARANELRGIAIGQWAAENKALNDAIALEQRLAREKQRRLDAQRAADSQGPRILAGALPSDAGNALRDRLRAGATTFQDTLDAINQETQLLQFAGDQRETENDVIEIKNQLLADGVLLQADQEEQLRAALKVQQEQAKAAKALAEQQRAFRGLVQEFSAGLVDAAFDADQSFSDFFGNFLENLAKAIAQALLLRAILAATGQPAGGIGDIGALFGFAQGGQFAVGGSGGTDSQLVAFRATPNEIVTVQTPEQAAAGGPGGGAVNVRTIVVNSQREAMLEVMRSREGEQVFVQHMSSNRRMFSRRY
jgi:hypothetical protein